MKIHPFLFIALSAAVGLTRTSAAVVITNGDFETVGSDIQDVSGWLDFTYGSDNGGSSTGKGDLQQGDSNGSIPSAPSGSNWLNIVDNNSFGVTTGVYQQIGTYEAGVTSYDVSFIMGLRDDAAFNEIELSLFKGTSGTAADGTTPIDAGLTIVGSSHTISFTGGPAPATASDSKNFLTTGLSDGDTLWLVLASTDNATGSTQQGLIDNISIAAIPEASSLILLGLGLVGLVAFRRRR